jgi:hypothetical protein
MVRVVMVRVLHVPSDMLKVVHVSLNPHNNSQKDGNEKIYFYYIIPILEMRKHLKKFENSSNVPKCSNNKHLLSCWCVLESVFHTLSCEIFKPSVIISLVLSAIKP